MDLVELEAAFQTAITAVGGIPTYTMDDTFVINATHNITYPALWMPIPDSTKLFSDVQGKGYESFAVPFTLYDLQASKTPTQRIARLAELELLANKVFRDLPINNTDIVDFTTDALTVRGTQLHNDRLLGVEIQLTLKIFTGWDCKT